MLDEIGELPAQTEVKFLRFLDSGEFRRVGETRLRQTDVRVIAATNRDLAALVGAGRFREDLFYRINVFRIDVPPLTSTGHQDGRFIAGISQRTSTRKRSPRRFR